MQKNVADIVAEICGAKVTGILTLSLKNKSSLLKIFFKNGEIYHLTHSTCKDRECLTQISGQEFVTGIFMPGAQVDTQQNEPSIPADEVVAAFRNANKTIEWTGQWDGRARAAGNGSIASTIVDPAMLARVGEELVNLAGPIAPMVLAQAYEACGLKAGQTITKSEFQRLIHAVGGKLPEEQRKQFLMQFS